MREHYTEKYNIEHEFDVWHISKSFIKKIKSIARASGLLPEWKISLSNHLWYSAMSCEEDGDLLLEKFTSCLNHVINVHEWDDGVLFHGCDHDEMPEEEEKETKWLHVSSQEYKDLRRIVSDKTFLKDLKHAKHYIHTGALEMYHNELLKYAPKRTYVPYNGMVLRLVLAALDHNHNVGRPVVGDPVLHYSRHCDNFVLRNTYEPKSYKWRDDLQAKVTRFVTDRNIVHVTSVEQQFAVLFPYLDKKIPLATKQKPPLEEAIRTHFTRFPKPQLKS